MAGPPGLERPRLAALRGLARGQQLGRRRPAGRGGAAATGGGGRGQEEGDRCGRIGVEGAPMKEPAHRTPISTAHFANGNTQISMPNT